MPKPKSTEFDLHIWVKPETVHMRTRVTVSRVYYDGHKKKLRPIAYDLPIEQAAKCISAEIEEAASIGPEVARTVPAPVCACCGEESAHGSKFCRKCSAKGCKEAADA